MSLNIDAFKLSIVCRPSPARPSRVKTHIFGVPRVPCHPRRSSKRAVARRSRVAATPQAPSPEIYSGVADDTWVKNKEEYMQMYRMSVEDPTTFWRDLAVKDFYWEVSPNEDHVTWNFDLDVGPIQSQWFVGGKTNVCYNALDRHVQSGHGDQIAFLFEGNDPGRESSMTYAEVLARVSQVANWLRSQGVEKGDAVAIYMPMVCELPIAMLACARIGAVHSVVFGGFSAEALASRLEDCEAKVLITASGVKRGSKGIDLKAIVDAGCEISSSRGHEVKKVLVYGNDDFAPLSQMHVVAGRDVLWQDVVASQSTECAVQWMEAEDPLFLLYTSGSTGKPKGVLHTTAGYMVAAATTTKYTFAMQPGDVFWCTADCGWITGHSYCESLTILSIRSNSILFRPM